MMGILTWTWNSGPGGPVSSHVGAMESVFLSVVVGTPGQASMLICDNDTMGLGKEAVSGNQEKRAELMTAH